MDTNPPYSQPSADRPPRFAGQFYPASESALREVLKQAYASTDQLVVDGLHALIVPHAGYVFSGAVAAAAYACIPREYPFKRIFILASSHRHTFPGASIFNTGDYLSPLGRVAVDRELAQQLMAQHRVFDFNTDAHAQEHSLEVQLPFLQYRIPSLPPIIPIVIGTREALVCEEIAKALRPYFTPDHLFIISSDFSHYPSYADACKVDMITARAITANDPGLLMTTLRDNARQQIPGLATSLCGWTSVLTLLYLTQPHTGLRFQLLRYQNSGDVPQGDKDGVVGYHAMAICLEGADKEDDTVTISEEGGRELLQYAREVLKRYLDHGAFPSQANMRFPAELMQVAGAFVSLYKGEELRGCIGRFESGEPLASVVADMVISAAVDSRFDPVRVGELADLKIEISVLGRMERISGPDDIQIGKHGVYVREGMAAGTLLPQVATRYGWSAGTFLDYCASKKAGLEKAGWQDAELFRFRVVVIAE